MAGELEKPALEVRVGQRVYRVWASGMTEGFDDGDQPVMVVNRIPAIVSRARKDAVDGR